VANADERLVVGSGDRVYVRGIDEFEATQYGVFRPGKAFRDPITGEFLGYEAVHIADGQLLRANGVATLALTNAREAVHPGDRVLPVEESPPDTAFLPRAPETPVEGQVISIPDGSPHVGRYAVVVVNLGEADGVEVGDVLAVRQAGRVIDDPMRFGRIELPEERAGLVMLFRVFDRVSYGLVMQAVRDISVHDVVSNPD
jgi:hypothetical protein